MIGRSFLLALYALVQVQRCNSAVSNRTIDDGNGDEVTGALPVYSQPDNWNVVVANNCPTCFVKLDPAQVFDKTWHDITVPAGTVASVTLNFTGTAIYFFGIVPNTVPSADTLVNLTFSLDGTFAGTYSHVPDTSTEILYSVPMLSQDGLSNEPHTLVAQAQNLLLFDFAIYTFDDGMETDITPVIPASTSTALPETGESPQSAAFDDTEGAGITSVIPTSASTALPATGEPLQSSTFDEATGTGIVSVILPSASTLPVLPVTDAHKFTRTSTGAKAGGALGSVVGLVALLAAAHQIFKAPIPGTSPDFVFLFVFPLPIMFRGKALQDAQITVVLRPAHLSLTNKKPGRGFTLAGSTATSYEPTYEPVAWKVFTLSAKEEGKSVRLPKDLGFGDMEESEGRLVNRFYNFAPLRTLVTKTASAAWISARWIIPGLGAMVVANNAAPQPIDFTLGTYHAKKDQTKDDFYPFVVVRGFLNSQFCVAPQCGELIVNAYITQNVGEHQLLGELFDPFADRSIPEGPSNTQEDPNAAPRPTIEDDDVDDDRSSKILSGALIGENGNGELVSTLKPKTKWHLVDDGQGPRLKIVTDDSENITEKTGLLEDKV